MAIGIMKIDTAAAIEMIDLTLAGPIELREEFHARALDPGECRVEFGVAHQESVMLRTHGRPLGIIEGYPVAERQRREGRPWRADLKAENIRQEPGGGPFVLRRNDRVIEFDAHRFLP